MLRISSLRLAALASIALLVPAAPAVANHAAMTGGANAPTVTIAANTTTPQPGQDVTFTATIVDGDLPADQHVYEWQFGDGAAFEVGTKSMVRSFGKGTHVVRVRVEDLADHVATAELTLTAVHPAPTSTFTIAGGVPPVAQQPLAFDASGTTQPSPGVSLVKYEWDLNGNGTFDTTCTGPGAVASFGSAGATTVTLRVTDSEGHESTIAKVADVAAPATSPYAPSALKPIASGCAGPSGDGTVPPGGAPAAITCYRTVYTGIAELMGACFRRTEESVSFGSGPTTKLFTNEVYTSDSAVRLNGINVRPKSGVTLRIDTYRRHIVTQGGTRRATASMNSGTTLGNLTFLDGRLDWKLPAGKAGRFTVATVPITEGAELLGLGVEGDARLDLVYRGTELPVYIRVPKPLDVSAKVTLKTDNMTGLRLDDVHLRVQNATFGAFEVRDLELHYSVSAAQFDGRADLLLSSVGRLEVAVQVRGRTLTMFAANFTPTPPLALGSGVFLQHVRFSYLAGPPLTLEGGVKLTAGPAIGGKSAAAIDGTLKYVADDPWMLRADGHASIVGVGMADAFVQYRSNGMFRMGGNVSGSFYDIVSASGNVGFWLYAPTGQFNAEGSVRVCVWKGCGGGALIVSNVGIGGCVYTWLADFGMGYRWGGKVSVFLTGCDIGTWRSHWDGDSGLRLRAHPRADAKTREDITVGEGERAAFFRIAGASGPPRVKVTGPDGTTIVTPEGTENYVQTREHVILQVPPHKATYVMVAAPAAGRWRVETVDGSAQIVSVHGADALPEPKVDATVTGRARARTLRYSVTPAAGQVVKFVERAGTVTQPLGSATGASGSIRFAPGDGVAGRRTIVAIVEQDGVPRASIDVATYVAPGPLVPPRPARVTVRRAAMSATITWSAAPRARRYRVVVTVADGRRFSIVQTRRTLVIPNLAKFRVLRVAVSGLRGDGTAGPAARAVSPTPRARR